ncbi:hypothetical protein Q8A67_001186 [Cirrhinus molitorella]|uniref:Ras-related protein Rab-3 n=1 Tax=Cirrhinus molitorella TaxID=172907 RepID=A0AA88Q8S0_9TELE|nr:hypothetical protein Q8A67_001186 [Cirrhinus molitorella]
MATEGDPTNFVKVLHLLVISFTWGMQVWVSFIAGFVLISQVSMHTFGLVQSKLFPFYFYCLLGGNAVSLAIYAVYHPRELLDWHEGIQMTSFFVAVIMAALNAQWFGPSATENMQVMQEIEKEHGLGNQVGMSSNKEGYTKLREQDPKYKEHRTTFYRYHEFVTYAFPREEVPVVFIGARDKASSIRVKMASVTDSRLQPSQKDAADQNFDYMFKLLIIGNSSVGKTSFLFRYADDSFTSAFVSTVGIDFKVKTVFRNNKRIKLQIWDTAGQERYRTITTAYYRGAMGFLLMYDITNQDSFNAVQDWATQIKTYSWDNAQVILVGNKCDLEDDRLVPTEDSQRLAHELGFQFFEASAKDSINVKQVFECLVDVICEKMNESMDGDDPVSNHKDSSLQDTSSEGHSGCAC